MRTRRRRSRGRPLRVHAHWLLAASAPLVLVPQIVHQNAWREWANSLWLIEHQRASLEALGRPSLFLNADFAALYPHHAFYGGTLFAIAGALAWLLRSAWAAYLIVLIGSLLLGYVGSWWLGRIAGLSPRLSHAPALLFIATPYTAAQIYGGGAFAEVVARAGLALLVAGGAAALTDRAPRRRALAVTGIGAFLMGASHNITLLYGSFFAALLLLGGFAALRRVPWRATGEVVAAAAVGVVLNGWYLLPDVVYGPRTQIAKDSKSVVLEKFDSVGHLLDPLPVHPPLTTQLPAWVLIWLVAAGLLGALRRADRAGQWSWRYGWGLLALLVVLMAWREPWRHAPELLTTIQYPLRLHIFAAVLVAILLVLALRRLRAGRSAAWTAALGVCLAAQLGVVGWVAVTADTPVHIKRHDVTYANRPVSFELGQQQQFRTAGGPRLPQPGLVVQTSRPQAEHEHITLLTEPADPGTVFKLDVIASPLVTVRGDARQVGLSPDGFIVAQVLPPAPNRPWRAVIEPSWPWPTTVGAGLSVLSLLIVAGWALVPRVRRRAVRS